MYLPWSERDNLEEMAENHHVGGVHTKPDKLAIAALVLTSTWLFWFGTFLGIVFALINLIRGRGRPNRSESLMWAGCAFVMGAIGVLTFAAIVIPKIHQASVASEDRQAKASLVHVAHIFRESKDAGESIFPVGSGRPWRVGGNSGITVVGSQVVSKKDDAVSAEVWNITKTSRGHSFGSELFLADRSASGRCFIERIGAKAPKRSVTSFYPTPTLPRRATPPEQTERNPCDAHTAQRYFHATTMPASFGIGI
jgi:hypothetical protein